MTDVPELCAVKNPAEPTVATVALLLLHVPPPMELYTVSVSPAHTGVTGLTTPATYLKMTPGKIFTVITREAMQPAPAE